MYDYITKRRIISTFFIILLLPPALFGLVGGPAVSLVAVMLFPSGLVGYLGYISKSLLQGVAESGGHILFGWLIYCGILLLGLYDDSQSAYRRWVILCVMISLLTWGGCGPVAEVSGPCFDPGGC